MWGDAERALRLDDSDSLSMLLFQVASPAHIPWNDPRWQGEMGRQLCRDLRAFF